LGIKITVSVRNLIIFIRRYFNFFLFLVILTFCLSLVFQHNRYQRAVFIHSANGLTGYFFRKYNTVQYYFHLKAVNDSLVVQNANLMNQLATDFAAPDSTVSQYRDTASGRQYFYMPARVINNTVNSSMNYLTLYRGSAQGVKPGMGVVGPQGIVGIVRKVSPRYAVVMSLLHKDMRISAMLPRSGNFGSVKWDPDRPDPHYGILTDIPKNVVVQVGDSVVTSGYSAIFPPGLMVGYVDRISEMTATNFHDIRIRFATRFRALQYVYVVENYHAAEQRQTESALPHE
jgi:rod shape-determining protein MreC